MKRVIIAATNRFANKQFNEGYVDENGVLHSDDIHEFLYELTGLDMSELLFEESSNRLDKKMRKGDDYSIDSAGVVEAVIKGNYVRATVEVTYRYYSEYRPRKMYEDLTFTLRIPLLANI